MAFANSKRIITKWALAKAKVVDDALATVAFLESECKRLARSVPDSANEILRWAFSDKEVLHVELALLKGKLLDSEKALMQERK